MFPPLTDFFALAGITVVLCAGCLYVPGMTSGLEHRANTKGQWLTGLCFLTMWFPMGSVMLPVAAYIRGFTSDFSVSLMALASLSLSSRLFGLKTLDASETRAVLRTVCAAALFMYPLALGWGDWDAYGPGWGSFGIWAGLLFLSIACWISGLRLQAMLIGLSLLSWTVQLLESTNLWDYLLDPWLACGAVFYALRAGARQLITRFSACKG